MAESLVCVKDFERHAFEVLPRKTLEYYRSGAGGESTLINNRTAFTKFKIRPRCLRNVSNRDLSTTVLGQKIEVPIGVSPTAAHKVVHPDGECASARAAQAMGTVFILSHGSVSTIEEVAEAAPSGIKWLQIYLYKDRELNKSLIQRAEKAGFKAVVLTVDSPVIGRRLAEARDKFVLPPHLTFANFPSQDKNMINYYNSIIDSSVEWKDLAWLQSITKLPVVVKGILSAEDATIAADLGLAGILVSNHGGRQLDEAPATIEVLPEIVKAVGDRVEIYLDSGVTDGTDAFKALAMGAKMVFVGRALVWGLVHSGEEGAKKVLDILKTELDYALALTGCSSVRNIDRDIVVHESYYSKSKL